jgi:serine/threonine protein kinase
MQTLSALSVEADCPNIVRYFNSWIEDDRIHIVMELCVRSLRQVKREAKSQRKMRQRDPAKFQDEGVDQFTDRGYVAEWYIRKVMRDCLLGLKELHDNDIVHLDIKPENVLEGKSGKYKLADLGMARFLTKITEVVDIPEGDCRYIAKELLSRETMTNLPDLKMCDVFSLGITAYELLTLEKLEKNGAEWRDLREGHV